MVYSTKCVVVTVGVHIEQLMNLYYTVIVKQKMLRNVNRTKIQGKNATGTIIKYCADSKGDYLVRMKGMLYKRGTI